MICNNRCYGCDNIVVITDVRVGKNNYVITIPEMNLCNNDKICFVLQGGLEFPKEPLPIKIELDGEKFFWLSKSGNYVYSDQIVPRRLYVVRVKTDTKILLNERCNLSHTSVDLPVISIPVLPRA